MERNKSDIFENIKVNSKSVSEDNFFVKENSLGNLNIRFNTEPSKRLNDYDSNLLENGAYKAIDDDLFKLEYQISKFETEIKEIDVQIQTARDIYDYNSVEDLKKRRLYLQKELDKNYEQYKQKSLSAKITGGVSGFYGQKLRAHNSFLKNKLDGLISAIMSNLPKSLVALISLKKSLNKLENINKSVDELVSLNSPLGENYNKYEQLSRFIIKANSIQAEISKQIKDK